MLTVWDLYTVLLWPIKQLRDLRGKSGLFRDHICTLVPIGTKSRNRDFSASTVLAERKGRTTSYGFLALFSSRILFLRTSMMAIGQTASLFVFYQIFIKISDIAGDRYLNMLILAVIDVPGKVLGKSTQQSPLKLTDWPPHWDDKQTRCFYFHFLNYIP